MVLGFIHQANQVEIQLSNLALQNASSPKVKDFANQMITDHTQADSQVVAFADDHHIVIPSVGQLKAARAEHKTDRTIDANRSKEIGSMDGEYAFYDVYSGNPGSVGLDFQATKQKLSNLKGADFDREYAKVMVQDHQLVHDRLVQSRTRITDPAEIKLVDQVLSTVNAHLSAAQQLNDSLSS